MAIVRTGGARVQRLESGGEDGSTEDEEERSPATASEGSEAEGFSAQEENGGGHEEQEAEEAEEEEDDSGMGSDELEITQLGEAGAEMCQVGDQSVALPLELYDLPGLGGVISLDAWNGLLSEDDRLRLAAFLPDLDQETFARTLVELLRGDNFHFGSPLAALFDRLKGGLCDPRIVLYRRGSRFAERRKHYYHLQRYHNSMVLGLWDTKDCWKSCNGYSLGERLRAMDAMKAQRKQKELGLVARAGSETDSESRESAEQFLTRSKPDKMGLNKAGKLGKERSKGVLRLGVSKGVGEEYIGGSGRDAAAALSKLSRQDNAYAYDAGVAHRGKLRRSIDGLHSEDLGYDRDLPRIRSQRPLMKPVKKELGTGYDINPYGNNYHDSQTGSSYYHGRNAIGSQGVTLAASFDPPYSENARSAKYSERDRIYGGKAAQNKAPKVEARDWPAGSHADLLSDWQRGQPEGDYRSRKPQVGHGVKVKSYKSIEQQINGAHSGSDARGRISQVKINVKSNSQHGRIGQKDSRSKAAHVQSEETESDSSERFEDGADMNLVEEQPNLQYSELHIPAYGAKKSNKLSKSVKTNYPAPTADFEPYQTQSKRSHRGKVAEPDYLRDVHVEVAEQISEVMRPPAARSERKRKGIANLDMHGYDNSELHDSNEKANESLRSPESDRLASRAGYAVQDSNGDFDVSERANMPLASCSSGSKRQKGRVELTSLDEHGEYAPSGPKVVEISGSSKKKSKKKPDTVTDAITVAEPAPVVPEVIVVPVEPEKPKKKYVPITPTIHTGFSFSIVHLLTAVKKAMVAPAEDTPVAATVTPAEVTPVAAMVTPTEVTPVAAKQTDGEENRKWFNSEEPGKTPQEPSAAEQAQPGNEVGDTSAAEQTAQSNSPALTVQDLVNRIKTNPGDPNILETQEPLQDLVRGVLKVLSSRTAPLGAKGWRALVAYDKSNKSWFWVGPLPSATSYSDPNEETSAEAWGIPHKMLVKLVDAFANWLKSGQETLKQIGSLPPPPAPNPANLDLKERFKDLRAQKSLNTISPSSDEARAYFQREEFLRYSIPDRAFCYTAADGEKSIVAPLRRGGGKPTSKARGHPMLLPDRPPHVTILCLVRDAASRLPGRTGTRADVCTLLKDSQYLNHAESNKEAAVNQVVSGALDRLHYERDPCVLYDNDKKLWTYLHRGREEEDFEDDGTSSTKKWKRPRKDSDPADPGAGNDDPEDDGTPNAKKQKKADADPTASGEDKDGVQDPSNSGLEGDLELDVVPSSTNDKETSKLVPTDARPDIGSLRPSVDAAARGTADARPDIGSLRPSVDAAARGTADARPDIGSSRPSVDAAAARGTADGNSSRAPEKKHNMALPVQFTSREFNKGADREGSKEFMDATPS
ncbi:hypothetical protein CFC21_010217 [Triticum aestivum]|uniref:DEUBAD domain-containing protein n=2 Tax=Triticum aestivum TaxID=4565 RepID=A0A9R1DJK4_WHEAT|nr:uncharacterized protein LOC123180137 [Triticum aestivum]KAF6993303.1 hypothetical protein CFC21_010217 [Triticum aestivum]